MLEGVTVLSQTSIYNGDWVLFLGAIIGLCFIGVALWMWIDEPTKGSVIATIVLGLLCGVLLWLGFGLGQHSQYKVTISDSVNFNEFSTKYTIVEQDGKIFTIAEKLTER